jgi:hypothetical protein
MKRICLKLAASLAVLLALPACGTIPGSDAVTAAAAVVTDAFTGPDTDYTNYLKHCRTEVAAQKEAAVADSKALEAGISSSNEKIQVGALVLLAAKTGAGGPKIGCTMARKPSISELLLGDGELLDLGKDLYLDSRAEKRFNRQLEANERSEARRLEHDRGVEKDRADLIRDMAGTYRDRKPAETSTTTSTTTTTP